MCPWNPGVELMSKWRFDMLTHLAVTSGKTQHEKDRMRDIQIGNRGAEAAGEEQPDKLWKTVRVEQQTPSAAASSDPTVVLQYLASGETQDRPGSDVDDDVQISLWIHSTRWMDERVVTSEKCWIGDEWKNREELQKDAKIDPKVVVLEEFIDENEPWLC